MGLVVGLGQCALDIMGAAGEYPPLDAKCELSELVVQGGGPAATAMVALSRLGIHTAFIGAAGDDEFGLRIKTELMDEGVDVRRLIIVPGGLSQTAFIFIHEPTGARTIFWNRGKDGERELVDEDLELIESAELLHLDGLKVNASLKAAQTAHKAGVPVVMDAGALRPGYLEVASLVDYLIVSEKFMADFHPGPDHEAGLVRLKDLGPGHVVVTLGDRGSLGFDGAEYHRQPAFEVKAVDTTGAGDVYHGGYIYGILSGWDMPACMRFASALAALKCRAVGGRTAIPGLDEVLGFLDEKNSGPA